MAKEIERKFLLTKGSSIPIPESFVKTIIKQGYIHIEKNKQIRIRIFKLENSIECASICVKYTGKQIRDEFEFFITPKLKEAKELYNKCELFLEKKRLSFDANLKGVTYDIDSFPNGMQWIEVEFDSIKIMKRWEKKKPYWVGKEVSNDSNFSNIRLAKKHLKFK